VLEAVEGPAQGQRYSFERYDTFLCGREPECALVLSGDPAISRHHFLLEVNPPRACLRDLGSRNGTRINGLCHGRRERSESPEQGALRKHPEVDLKDGDLIQVGKTVLRVAIDREPAFEERPTLIDRPGEKDSGAPELPRIPAVEITRCVGRGGFGAVYLGRRTQGAEVVAVKTLLAQVAVDEATREGFQREIRVLSSLVHPHIVRFYEQGSIGELFYFVMEYCDGGSVYQEMRKGGGRLPMEIAIRRTLDSLEGLACAHEMGIIHRDVKPHNLLLSGTSTKVSDFGLAKSFEGAGLSGMTLTGCAAGSPDYMPREQVTDYREVKPSSDVWSMAASFYEMLTGRPPRGKLKGEDPVVAVLQTPVVPILDVEPAVPKPLAKVLGKALENKPGSRFRNAGEFRDALLKVV
jgi:pSer/pThr/pTyr-binding forkhead associated (FHA) protein